MVPALVVQRPCSVGMLSVMWLFTVSWYAVLVVLGIRPYDVVGPFRSMDRKFDTSDARVTSSTKDSPSMYGFDF